MLISLLVVMQSCLVPQGELKGSDTSSLDRFGESVDFDGVRIVVGADANAIGFQRHGSAYVFRESAGTWVEEAILSPSTALPNSGFQFKFGRSVAIDGDLVVVGAPDASPDPATAQERRGLGFAYILSGGSWVEEHIIDPNDPSIVDLGVSADVSGDWVALGSADPGGNSGPAGTCVLADRNGGAWLPLSTLKPSDTHGGDRFGWTVRFSGNTLFVGAPNATGPLPGTGAVYVFTRSGGVWTQVQKLAASDGLPGDEFGASLAVSGNLLVIGAPRVDPPGQTTGILLNAGAVYVFERVGGTWLEQVKILLPGLHGGQQAGVAIALDHDSLAVGSPDWVFTPGYVDLVRPSAGKAGGLLSWTGVVMPASNQRFGASLAHSHGTLIVGAPGQLVGGVEMGAVHVYSVEVASLDATPSYFCQAKQDSEGCIPRIFHQGLPSLSAILAGEGYDVVIMEAKTASFAPFPGVLLYSTNGEGNVPFANGTLCLQVPTVRTPVTYSSTSGTPFPCLAEYRFDFGSYFASGVDPTLVPGQPVWLQWWYRDPGGIPPNDIGLSAGLRMTICP